jgi:hypothetical protein
MFTFQADAASLLKLVEWFGIWRLWAATKLTTAFWFSGTNEVASSDGTDFIADYRGK